MVHRLVSSRKKKADIKQEEEIWKKLVELDGWVGGWVNFDCF